MMTTKQHVVRFMAAPGGRGLRIAAGLGLLTWRVRGGARWAAVGAVPLLAGALDVCLLGPALGEPFRGADVRRTLT